MTKLGAGMTGLGAGMTELGELGGDMTDFA